MQEKETVEYLLRFIEICQNGFVRPDKAQGNVRGNDVPNSANTTGVVRDSKDLKDYAIGACKRLSRILDFEGDVVVDLSNRNRHTQWEE
jgi:hypothetical protein